METTFVIIKIKNKMVLTFEDFKNKFKPFIGNDGKTKIFSANDEEVRNGKNSKTVWDVEERDNTIMKIVPNRRLYITFGMHIVTEHPFAQHHEETLKVVGPVY